MAQYIKILPSFAAVSVDIDPTFTDQIPTAYLSALVYIPSSAQADISAQGVPLIALVSTDAVNLSLHKTGGNYFWSSATSGAGHDFAPLTFDAWVQVEMFVDAGASTFDARIGGTLYSGLNAAGLPASGVNFIGVTPLPASWVGDGGGNSAGDYIGVDELSYAIADWVSISGADAIWAFEDTADPIGVAAANYPTPPWDGYDGGNPANLVVAAGGGSEADLLPGGGNGGGGGGSGSGYSTFEVALDGVDVTSCSLNGSWTPRLNRPAQAQVKLPSDCSSAGVGSRLKITLNGTIVFHGMVLLCETDCDENFCYTTYNAQDPMELWDRRPVRADDGDFSKPDIDNLNGATPTGSEMIEAMLLNTVSAGGGPPADAEGPIFLDMGTFETGGYNLTGAPVDWPMTIAELSSLLISTGTVDVVITPTDPGGGVMGTVDGYNGDYGTDLSATVLFQYGTGAYNVSALRWNQDMTTMCNKLWYYMGPRVKTFADPAGDQHWCYNITGTDPGLPDPTPIKDGMGGYIVRGAEYPSTPAGGTLLGVRDASRSTYGVRMDIQIFDAESEDCVPSNPLTAAERQLYRNRWEMESWLRQTPRSLIHITPTPGFEIGTFGIGDLVHVEAVSAVRGGFSGAQRVYSYTVSWDENSVLSLSELQTSADSG